MAYNKFKKLSDLRKNFGINESMDAWIPPFEPLFSVSDILLLALQEAASEPLATEKAKSESVVVPVLKELRRKNEHKFSFFSGYQLEVDTTLGLNGYCDFILSAKDKKMEITAPIFCLVEAKDGEIEKGLAQCGAEMYAAKLYNKAEGNPREVIYGCVTNAFSWAFLKLENQMLYIDPNYVPLTFTEPHKVLTILQWILDDSLK